MANSVSVKGALTGAAGAAEMIIKKASLEQSEKKLADLYKVLNGRKLNVNFQVARGATVDETLNVVNKLNEIGVSLAELIRVTEQAVANTRILFGNADDKSAKNIKMVGD